MGGKSVSKYDRAFVRLVAVTLISSFYSFGLGAIMSWSSPALVKLKSNDSEENPLGRPATDEEISWIGSIPSLTIIVSSLLAGYLSRYVGPKVLLLAGSLPTTISFIILFFAEDIYLYYIARALSGFGVGGCITVHIIYISELAPDNLRGAVLLVVTILMLLGQLFALILGAFLSVQMLSGCCGIPSALFFLMGQFLPEGPKFLISQGKEAEALEILKSIRSQNESQLRKEIEDIRENFKVSQASALAYKEIFTDRKNLKMLLLNIFLLLFLELAGNSMFSTYLQIIFKAANTPIDDSYAAIGFGTLQLVVTVSVIFVIDKFNRKTFVALSGLGASVSLIFLGLYFFLMDNGTAVEQLNWLPLVSAFCYIVFYDIGVKPIPMIVLGEVLPPKLKEKSASIVYSACLAMLFLITKFFPSLVNAVGMGVTFWILAFNNLLFVVFFALCFPETRGKTLSQIQDMIK